MMYADDVGVVSVSPRGPARMMNVLGAACQTFELTSSKKKTEAMHPWFNLSTLSNALQIKAADQRYKPTTEFMYLLGNTISESADLIAEIKRRLGAGWASLRRYSFQSYDRRNARLSFKIRLFEVEVVVEVMLYKCTTWTMRSQDFVSLRTAHHKLLFASAAFGARLVPGTNLDWTKRRLRGPIPNDLKRQFGSVNLGSPGPLFSKTTQCFQCEYCLGGWWCKGPRKEIDRRRSGGTTSRKTSRLSGQSRAKFKGRNGLHSDVLSMMDAIEWLLRRTWAFGIGRLRGERKHSITPDDAWTFANPTHGASARHVDFYSSYVCDHFVLPFC